MAGTFQSINAILDSNKDADRKKKQQQLYDTIGLVATDYDAMKVDAPEKPEIDQERMGRYQSLSKVGAIAAGVDAISNAIGVASNPNWQPAVSPVSQLGVHSYDNIRNMDQDHRTRLDQWRADTLTTDRHNQTLDVKAGEEENQILRTQLENQLRDMRTEYEQGELNAREYARAISGLTRDYAQQGFSYNYETGELTPLPGSEQALGAGTDREAMNPIERIMHDTGATPQDMQLFDYMSMIADQIRETDYDENGRPKPGTAAANYEDIKRALGQKYYLIDYHYNILEQNQRQTQRAGYQGEPREELLQGSQIGLQRAAIEELQHAQSDEQRVGLIQNWMDRNTQILTENGIPEEEHDRYNQEMFDAMMEDMYGTGQEDQQQSANDSNDPRNENRRSAGSRTQENIRTSQQRVDTAEKGDNSADGEFNTTKTLSKSDIKGMSKDDLTSSSSSGTVSTKMLEDSIIANTLTLHDIEEIWGSQLANTIKQRAFLKRGYQAVTEPFRRADINPYN